MYAVTPESLASFAKAALEHENFKTAVRLELDRTIRGPLLQPDFLMRIFEQRNVLHAATFLGVNHCHLAGIQPHTFAIGGVELPELDEHHAARFRAGGVMGLRWIADVRSSRIIAMLILKHALEHEEFLAATVYMG